MGPGPILDKQIIADKLSNLIGLPNFLAKSKTKLTVNPLLFEHPIPEAKAYGQHPI
jgi:hypothetical protein